MIKGVFVEAKEEKKKKEVTSGFIRFADRGECITAMMVDEAGNVLSSPYLFSISKYDGTIHLTGSINPAFEFDLDGRGRLKII